MKSLNLRFIICMVLLALFTCILVLLIGCMQTAGSAQKIAQESDELKASVSESVQRVLREYMVGQIDVDENAIADTRLKALALRNNGDYQDATGSTPLNNGFILQKQGIIELETYNNTLVYLDSALLEDEYGLLYINDKEAQTTDVVTYALIQDDYYYLSRPLDKSVQYMYPSTILGYLDEISSVYNGKIIVADRNNNLFYGNNETFSYDINQLEQAMANADKNGIGHLAINGEPSNSYSVYEIPSGYSQYRIWFLAASDQNNYAAVQQIIAIALTAVFICLIMAVWVVSAQKMAKRYALTQAQKLRYNPGRVKHVVLAIGFIGIIVIAVISLYSAALSALHQKVQTTQEALSLADNLMEYSSILLLWYATALPIFAEVRSLTAYQTP